MYSKLLALSALFLCLTLSLGAAPSPPPPTGGSVGRCPAEEVAPLAKCMCFALYSRQMRIDRNVEFRLYCRAVFLYGMEDMAELKGSCKGYRKDGKVDAKAVVDAVNEKLHVCLDNPEDYLISLV